MASARPYTLPVRWVQALSRPTEPLRAALLRAAVLVAAVLLAGPLLAVAGGGSLVGTPATIAEPRATTGATGRDDLPLVGFVRADGSVVQLPLEVPPPSEYFIGLSGRTALDERGMLFHYPSGGLRVSFWMKNTHFDLAIAFVSSDLRIVEIRAMVAESLDLIRPDADHQYVVEAPAGWYAEHGIAVGDEVRFLFEIPGADEGGE